jgi:lipid-A-disaccharide synthase
MKRKQMKLLIVAGEVSGDIHAAHLISAIKDKVSDVEIRGIGGDLMIAAGLKAKYHIRQMAFLGLSEIIRHLPFIRRVFNDLTELVKSFKPDAVILVDYPGFNLRFARKMKKMAVPVIYYISPQLWAWGRGRIKKIRAYVDKMLVVFPFEVDFYRKFGIEADYVGHPLVDSHFKFVTPKKYSSHNRVLGLLPGSRKQELDKLFPVMIATAEILHAQGYIDMALVARVGNITREEYEKYIGEHSFIKIHENSLNTYYNQLDAAIVSSGTATLETAYFQVPLLIVYKVGRITWNLGKRLVKLDSIGLANIVAGKKVAEELLQNDFTPHKAAEIIKHLLEPDINWAKRNELQIIQDKLGEPGASQRAAEEIIRFVQDG